MPNIYLTPEESELVLIMLKDNRTRLFLGQMVGELNPSRERVINRQNLIQAIMSKLGENGTENAKSKV